MSKNIVDETMFESELIAQAIGCGLLSGAIGTFTVAASQKIEKAVEGCQMKNRYEDEEEELLEMFSGNDIENKHLSLLSNFGYGTGWGLFRAALEEGGVRGWTATVVHFAAMFGTDLVLRPKMGGMEPITKWRTRKVMIDAAHHALYCIVVGATYDKLKKNIPA